MYSLTAQSLSTPPASSMSSVADASAPKSPPDFKKESGEIGESLFAPIVPHSVDATLATFPAGLNDQWNKSVFNFMNKVRDSGVYNMMGSEGLVKHVKRELNCERTCAEDFVREYCMDFDKLESFYKEVRSADFALQPVETRDFLSFSSEEMVKLFESIPKHEMTEESVSLAKEEIIKYVKANHLFKIEDGTMDTVMSCYKAYTEGGERCAELMATILSNYASPCGTKRRKEDNVEAPKRSRVEASSEFR